MAPTDVFTLDILRNYLLVGAVLFALGMLGFLSRRNLIVMFLSVEMMLQGTALSLVGFGRYHGTWTGQIFTIVILTVAACEASIALALIVILYNQRSSLDVTLWQDIREADVPATSRRRRSSGGRAGRGRAGPRVVSSPDPGRHRACPIPRSRGSSGGIEESNTASVSHEAQPAATGRTGTLATSDGSDGFCGVLTVKQTRD